MSKLLITLIAVAFAGTSLSAIAQTPAPAKAASTLAAVPTPAVVKAGAPAAGVAKSAAPKAKGKKKTSHRKTRKSIK
jgi:hypothetical protein